MKEYEIRVLEFLCDLQKQALNYELQGQMERAINLRGLIVRLLNAFDDWKMKNSDIKRNII